MAQVADRTPRGRRAGRPRDIPLRGWGEVLWRVKGQFTRDRLSIVAAGVAFYALLAVFPALGALISLYGLAFDPQQVTAQLAALEGVFPKQALEVVLDQFEGLSRSGSAALGLGAALGFAFALWSASAGIKTLMEALNVAYDEREERSFLKRTAVGFALTLGAIAGGLVAIGVVVLLPAALRLLGLDATLGGVISYARWPILAASAVIGFSILYRYGPSRARPRWSWVLWGAVIATVLWLAGSALFSWYVSNFGRYNQTYGSVAAIVILLLWFLLSAYAVLIGAEVNAELERQTHEDVTAA